MKEEEMKRTHSSIKLRVRAALIIGRCGIGVFRVWVVRIGLGTIMLGGRAVVGGVLWGIIRGRGGLESGC